MEKDVRLFLISATLLMLLPALSNAGDSNFHYTYVDVQYHNSTFERFDGDGFGVEGAYAFGSNYFLFARFVRDSAQARSINSSLYPEPPPSTGFDILNTNLTIDASVDEFAVGAGMVWHLSEAVDVSGKIFYTTIDNTDEYGGTFEIVDENGEVQRFGALCGFVVCAPAGFDDSGFGLEASIRGAIAERFELFGNFTYVDIDFSDAYSAYVYADSLSDTTIEIGGRFTLTQQLSVSLAALKRDEFESTQLGVRFDF